MDFKALNEEVKALLESGFAVSGKRDEVQDILQKLTQEYGDLTIPEFIDKLIQAEQKGEEILDESLKEAATDWNTLQNNLLNTLQRKILALKLPIISEFTDGSGQYTDIKFSCERTYANCIEGHTNKQLTGHIYPNKITGAAGFKIGLYNITKSGATDPYRKKFQIRLEPPICQFKAPEPKEWTSFTVYDGAWPIAICFETEIDIEDYNEKQLIKDVLFIFKQNSIEKQQAIANEKQRKQTDFNNATKEFEELAKARREARANRNAKNTTVKQALSKSAVAKKIRELQNPTPEQLAKILAAIEG